MKKLPVIKLKIKKDIPIKAGHPWIFSNAIEKQLDLEPGALVSVVSHTEEALGIGTFNSNTSIRVRIITNDAEAEIDAKFFTAKFLELDERKRKFLLQNTDGYRVAHADADSLPGLIVDRYADVFVFQIHTAGMEQFRNIIIEALKTAFKPVAIVERSDVEVRKREGLKDSPVCVHYGNIDGPVEFSESGHKFLADVLKGQKTGFFLDQRDARIKVLSLAGEKCVLNLFGYTGAFSVYAAMAGAKKVITVDASGAALELAKKNFILNDIAIDKEQFQFIEADVFNFLNNKKIYDYNFDFIICDPPAYAKTSKDLSNALLAYTNLNKRCFALLKEKGILVTSSCSAAVGPEDFKNVLRLACGQAARDARILDFIGQPFDHTQKLSFPEGRYLNTAFLEVI